MEYRDNSYFNEGDTFLFNDAGFKKFESKVHFENGYWWTNESLQFKATTLKCKKL
tara:strand:- start:13816 stop:13980 length:165 start_codon:yes stop_codon:yes gene_type:complete